MRAFLEALKAGGGTELLGGHPETGIILDKLVVLILLCYKRRMPQKGQPGSCPRIWRAMAMRSVAMEAGLCRSERTGRAARLEVRR
jgi:hypothetical protein